MSESWVNLYCTGCSDEKSMEVSDLPDPDDEYECTSCGRRAKIAEFLATERDLEVYESLKT